MRGATPDHHRHRRQKRISIHAPHAGRDATATAHAASFFEFQSTRPMRGATQQRHDDAVDDLFQSTRPMRGAT